MIILETSFIWVGDNLDDVEGMSRVGSVIVG
jgi:hypothetical protein